MPITELSKELTENLAIPQDKVNTFQTYVEAHHDVASAGDLQKLTDSMFQAAVCEAKLTAHESLAICICLGSAQCPFEFAPDRGNKNVGSDNDDDVPLATLYGFGLKTPASTGGMKLIGDESYAREFKPKLKEKGGIVQEVAEILKTRREPMYPETYHLPVEFHVERKGSHLRNENRLRQKIVQEIEAVCGDLYPSSEERSVILGKVEQECGPPTSTRAPHWDVWKDADKKRRKGTAVSDLEKARKNPESYGVTGKAFHGMMRPARPFVPCKGAPTEPAHHVPPPAADPLPDSGGSKADDSDDESDHYGEDDFADLNKEKKLMQDCKQLEGRLKLVQAEQAALRKAAAEAKQKAKDAKAAAKGAGKKRKPESTPANMDQENVVVILQAKAVKPSKGEPADKGKENKSEYEKKRDATIAQNKSILQLVGKATAANCEVMDVSMVPWLRNKDGVPTRYSYSG
jgi:hypothetical protein